MATIQSNMKKQSNRPAGYWKAYSAKRRKNAEYRKEQSDRCRKWYKLHGKAPERLKRKAEQQRKYRNDPARRMKHEARWQINRAIAAGRIKKQPCSKCRALKVEAHHPDYFKPLEVVWLCRSCHMKEHTKATQP